MPTEERIFELKTLLDSLESSTTNYMIKLTDRVMAAENRLTKVEGGHPAPNIQETVNKALTSKSESPRFSSEVLPFNTKGVAERILADLETRYPHPLTKVNWKIAGKAMDLTAEALLESLTALYGNHGLTESLLVPLARCGWTLALVRDTTAYPLTGEVPVQVSIPPEVFSKKLAEAISESVVIPTPHFPKLNPTIQDQILGVLHNAKGKPITAKDIVKATGLTIIQVRGHLCHLMRKKLIFKIEPGIYRL